MKVLYISSDNSSFSGAFLCMKELSAIMCSKYNVKSEIVLPCDGSGEELLKEDKSKYHKIRSFDWACSLDISKNLKYYAEILLKSVLNRFAISKIARIIRDEKFDLVHINTTYSYVGAKAAIRSGVPFVWHLREFVEEDQNNRLYNKKKGYRLINKADAILAISNSIYSKYRDVFDNDRMHIIYDGLDKDIFYNPNKKIFQNAKVIFLCVGSIKESKGQHTLVEACGSLLNSGYKDFELWLAGSGSDEAMELINSIIKKYRLENHIRLLGHIKNIVDVYRNSDITFMCSKSEAFGRVTVEAMLGGNLVIGANTACTTELIKDSKTGMLYEYGNHISLVEVIKKTLSSRNEMVKIADAGRRFALEQMTLDANADNIYKIYNKILY